MEKKSMKKYAASAVLAAAIAAIGSPAAMAADGDKGSWLGDDFSFSLTGYARGWVSMNLRDQKELSGVGKESAGKLSMVRGSILLDADVKTGPIKWKAIGRMDREHKTNYLRDLEKLRSGAGNPVFSDNTAAARGNGDSILDNYNNDEIRELWAEFGIGERTTVKIGKQQLVWGESDFFHAMDLVHGYDLSWRLFFEDENEEWRKPLFLISTKIRIPEANGLIAAFIRPGLDRCEDIGNTYDIRGGRWFFQPYRGYDLTTVTGKNCNHKAGDYHDVTGGIRWQGEAFDLNYSIAYLTTFSADPVANSAFAPYKQAPKKSTDYFDLIHPEIQVLGATVSGYSATLDAVLSAEVAYTKDQPYNVGTGALVGTGLPEQGAIGIGLGGVKLKDTLTAMFRIDKNLHFEESLGTSRPSFSSIQIFNTQVLNFDKDDDLVRLFAYGTRLTEHNTIVTAFTVLNYANDTINPSFAIGFDATHGGGFAIPAVSLVLNDKWLAKIEADLFWDGGKNNNKQYSNQSSQLFGYFQNSDQLVVRLTRQF